MAEIIPHICRLKLARGQHYPLHYADLESCFADHATGPIYLAVYFTGRQALRKAERDGLEADGRYHLLELHYDPERPGSAQPHDPWSEVDKARVVHATIYAVPREATAAVHLDRSRLRAVLLGQLDRFSRGGLLEHRWALRIDLLETACVLECLASTWTGLRPEPESRVRLPLERPGAPRP
jgi:hypothetical protein